MWLERLHLVKMSASFPYVEVGTPRHPSQNRQSVDKLIVKFTWKCRGCRISQIGFEKEQNQKISLPAFLESQKSFLQRYKNQSVWSLQRDRQSRGAGERPEIDPHVQGS